jgi:hypothetical protein
MVYCRLVPYSASYTGKKHAEDAATSLLIAMGRNKLYLILSTACAIGYIWLSISYIRDGPDQHGPGLCLFKHITGIPCPSCGTTRSVLSLLHGDVTNSLIYNPFGVIIMLIMVILPIWISFDLVNRKSSLLKFYNRTELLLKRTYIAVPALLIVLSNWIWNICKGI